jgi:hypothetical protein
MNQPNAYSVCEHCGAMLHHGARFCRECGSSQEDGWSDQDCEGDLDEEFVYDEYVHEEFGDGLTNTHIRPMWKWVAVLLLVTIWLLALAGF